MFSSTQFQTLRSVLCFLIITLAANALANGKTNGEKQTPATAINQVLPGVWRVGGSTWGIKDFPTVSVHGDSNVYLVRLREGLVLVDCATIKGMPIIEENIRRAGFDPDEISDLFIPHSHADHTEAAGLWRTRYSLRTHLSEVGAIFLDRKDSSLLGYVGGESPLSYAPFHVDHRVRDGEVFQVAGTVVTATFVPGHTLDSTLFTLKLNGQTVGFSGDLVFGPADWNEEGGGLGAMRTLWKSSLSDYRDSLKRVLEMEIDILLTGHGHIISGSDNVLKELTNALKAVERFLAIPKIYVFGMHKPQLKVWMEKINGKKSLREVNNRFKNLKVHIVNWPDELYNNLGKLKRHAYMGFPENKPSGKLPLLIALHGAGGKRKTLEEQLLRSSEVKGLALAELSGRDLILLEPNSSDSWDVDKLDIMLDYVLSTYKEIDEKRIYVVGHSMGGSGAWRWILQSPDRFAAAAPCGFGGGANPDGIEVLKDLPIWAMVGGDDGGNVASIQKMVDNLRAIGNVNVRHTAFPGANHPEGNAAVFSSVELVEWMLTFSLSE